MDKPTHRGLTPLWDRVLAAFVLQAYALRIKPWMWLTVGLLTSCSGASSVPKALYPSRPTEEQSAAFADPPPSRVVMHTTITASALRQAVEQKIPLADEGTFAFLGGTRAFSWRRDPVAVRFDRGRVGVSMHVVATADLRLGHVDLPIDVTVLAEPVLSSDYVARLQSVDVHVSSSDRVVKVADSVAGILEKVRASVEEKITGFAYSMRPLLEQAYERLSRPVELTVGDAKGCAKLSVLGIEAGPTVLADGVEKDFAMLVAPSVTLPCPTDDASHAMPPLANVATIVPGPFTVALPIAARYDELAHAMSAMFTDGKLYFSKEHSGLYLEHPEVYASKDLLVLKLHLAGNAHALGFDHDIDGDLFMSGHPVVEDNEIRIPDLEPTVETSNFLLALKSTMDARSMRDQARAALRLDIGQRVQQAKAKLSSDLAFGDGTGCLRADATKVEVTGIHAHASYLRVTIGVTGIASAYLPCPN